MCRSVYTFFELISVSMYLQISHKEEYTMATMVSNRYDQNTQIIILRHRKRQNSDKLHRNPVFSQTEMSFHFEWNPFLSYTCTYPFTGKLDLSPKQQILELKSLKFPLVHYKYRRNSVTCPIF